MSLAITLQTSRNAVGLAPGVVGGDGVAFGVGVAGTVGVSAVPAKSPFQVLEGAGRRLA